MLKQLQEQDFETYVDFAYELALDLTRSGYPTYADGVKTKKDFVDRARAAFSREGEGILLYEQAGKVRGWIHYYHLPEDCYLDTCAFCVAEGTETALAEFTAFARAQFPGSALYLGFPKENTEAVAALESHGFARIEESFNDVLDLDSYIPQAEDPSVISITRENYPLFAELHSQHRDMYWNSERIRKALDSWKVFVLLQEGKAAGAIYSRVWEDDPVSEIFGIDFPGGVYDSGVYRTLLHAMLRSEKRRGAKHMIFFNDGLSQPDALACGFRCVSEYVCFKIDL